MAERQTNPAPRESRAGRYGVSHAALVCSRRESFGSFSPKSRSTSRGPTSKCSEREVEEIGQCANSGSIRPMATQC